MTRFATPLILAALLAVLPNHSTESPTAPTQTEKGTIPSSPSPGPAASSGRMRLTEPATLDFNDHEGYESLFDGVSLKKNRVDHETLRQEYLGQETQLIFVKR